VSAVIQRPPAEGRFIVEINGIRAIVATEATPPGFKHTPVKYQPGNQHMPTYVRGNSEIEEFTFKHARAVGQVGQQLVGWLRAWASGTAVERLTARFITMDETGRTPVETWELVDCLPTQYKPETSSGTGTNVAAFTFGLQPSDARLI
jgi:phage tail-like protein